MKLALFTQTFSYLCVQNEKIISYKCMLVWLGSNDCTDKNVAPWSLGVKSFQQSLIWAEVGIHTSSSYDDSSTAHVDSNECNTNAHLISHSGFVVLFNAILSFSKGIF